MTYSYDYRKELLGLKGELKDVKNNLSRLSDNITDENTALKKASAVILKKTDDNFQQMQMMNNRLNEIDCENTALKKALAVILKKTDDNFQQMQMMNNRLNAIEEVLKILVVRDTVSDIQKNIK